MHVNCSLTWQSSDAAVLLVVFSVCLSVLSSAHGRVCLSVCLVQRGLRYYCRPTYLTYLPYLPFFFLARPSQWFSDCRVRSSNYHNYYLTYFLLYFHCIVLHLLLTTSYYYSFLPTFSILLTQSSQLRHPVSLSFNSPLLCRHINVQEIC
ncbi:uncharacterized protein BO87DRAFT_36490 [Aspergillus neoniger CBS 115656]|uniref:Uncharacterized protein n=1 Tax=Aspergillus neoniger (strain CBS 115656) TaxID=1448310 RepID=A0A318YLK0_ASPNB|nr:hypothetical protein BO87DRAFT_36490 [Aspergillus neoniger CBS 115656]PYH35054.1 hypothetical protein BO87DRAFT_36490 [Aspergillus neoniger CBS 115656]